jgi:ArsR family transcriptional regulator, arsenate/arsenite/antimonite-responsive transcriptional repressor
VTASIKQLAKTFVKCAPLFDALREPARQRIILVLAECPEMNVGDLTDQVKLSRPAVSHHLRELKLAGLVRVRRQGTENFYALEITAALGLLTRFIGEAEACTKQL